MKSRLIPICVMVALSLFLLACSPTAKQGAVEISCDDFYEQNHISRAVEVATGDSFTVTLCSNQTTGFSWSEQAQIGDQTLLQQTGHEFISPGEKGLLGAAGEEVWTFQALNKGEATVSMEYSRPWEGGEKGTWTFNLTVVVK